MVDEDQISAILEEGQSTHFEPSDKAPGQVAIADVRRAELRQRALVEVRKPRDELASDARLDQGALCGKAKSTPL